VIEISVDRHSQAIADRVVTAFARDRVAQALHEAIVAGLDIGPCALPQPADREWIREAIAAPIQLSTDAALEALRRALAQSFQEAPPDLIRRLETSQRLLDLELE
jgi:hypothetical protein